MKFERFLKGKVENEEDTIICVIMGVWQNKGAGENPRKIERSVKMIILVEMETLIGYSAMQGKGDRLRSASTN